MLFYSVRSYGVAGRLFRPRRQKATEVPFTAMTTVRVSLGPHTAVSLVYVGYMVLEGIATIDDELIDKNAIDTRMGDGEKPREITCAVQTSTYCASERSSSERRVARLLGFRRERRYVSHTGVRGKSAPQCARV